MPIEPRHARTRLETVCPNNHNQTVHLSKEEFDAAMATGSLEFHCHTCDTSWPPTKKEIQYLREIFGEHSGQG